MRKLSLAAICAVVLVFVVGLSAKALADLVEVFPLVQISGK